MKYIYSLSRAVILIVSMLILNSGRSQAQVSAYSFSQSNGTYTALSGGTVVATATGTSGAASLDDVIYNLPSGTIPFNFTFDNVVYTGCNISTNGFITFGATPPAASGSTTGQTPLSAATAYSGAASPLARNLNAYFFSGNAAQTGEIRYQTLGSSPNRIFVVQWKNFKTFNTSGASYTGVINMQVRLLETSNAVEFVYNCSGAIVAASMQVGLRGPNSVFPTNVINRSVITGTNTWATSTAGTSNASTCDIGSTILPASGLTYRFAPAACPLPASLGVTNMTQTAGQLTWTSGGGSGPYTVEWGPQGFTPGTGTTVSNAVSPLSISGLTSGANYAFYVKQNCGAAGMSQNAGPYNFSAGTVGEDCATALSLGVSSSLGNCSFTTVSSGVSSNGPGGVCSDATGNVANDDRWYKFVAPAGNKKIVITTQAGTVNDWVMEVWTGCNGTVLKCADDVNGFMPEISLCQDEYTAGQTLWIRVWTYSQTASGNMQLCVYQDTQCAVPPVNDECVNAITLPVNPPLACPTNAQVFNTNYATASTGAATCDNGTKRDMWFKFNTGNSNGINMTINKGSATSLKAELVFECGGFEINCYSPAEGTYQFLGLNPMADYVIRVWSDTLMSGTFSICLANVCAQPTATLSGSQTICTGSVASTNVAFTGVPPFSFTYTNGTTQTNVVTSSNPYKLLLSPTSTTTYSLVSMTDGACSGTVSGSATVTVVTPQTVTINPWSAVCSNAGLQTLTGGSPAGGVYSGTNVSAGKFDPSGGTKAITYTVTYAPSCTRSASQNYPVNTAPTVTFGAQAAVCSSDAPFALSGGSPAGGSYSGIGVSGGTFNPATAGVGTKTLTYTYTNAAGCTNSATTTITVNACSCANPATVNAGNNLSSCGGALVTLQGSIGGSASSATWSNGGGTFSPNNTTLNATYTPSASEISAGTAKLYLTTNDPDGAGSCNAAKDSVFITIVSAPTPTLANFTPVCINAGSQTLSGGSPAGGVYSGTNVSGGSFNPSGGSQTITYTVTYAAGCSKSTSKVFTVNPLPTVTLGAFSAVCASDAPFTLTGGSPAGGTYSGPGVSGSTFNPASAGTGTKTITYTYTNGNGCTNSASSTITVNSCGCSNAPVANAGVDKSSCGTGAVSVSGTIGGAATSATWSGGSGNYSPNTTSLNINYTPSAAEITQGFARLILTTNDPDGAGPCVAAKDTMIITLGTITPAGAITGSATACSVTNGIPYSITARAGVTYTWTVQTGVTIASGQGTNAITVNFLSNVATSTTIKVKITGACGSDSSSVVVAVTKAVPSTPGSITGINTTCPTDSFLYTIRKMANVTSYRWTPPVGATINGSSAAFVTPDTFVYVTFTPAWNGDTLRVAATNCKGTGANRTLRINKRTTNPGTPGVISGQSTLLCGVSQVTYSIANNTAAKSYTWRTNIAGALINGSASPVTTTALSVVVTFPGGWNGSGNIYVLATNGCSSSAERSLALSTKPGTPTSITGSATACINQTNAAYSTPAVTGATSYTWTIPSGVTLVSGQNTRNIVVNFSSATGTRTLQVKANNACGASGARSLAVVVSNCVSSRIGETSDNVEAYPNPTAGALQINLDSEKGGEYQLQLFDASGRIQFGEVVNAAIGHNALNWDLSDLASGIYILNVRSDEGTQQVRIFVE